MRVKLTTDWHLGALRRAGATPQSNSDMQEFMFEVFCKELDTRQPQLICGDLLDSFTVDAGCLLRTHDALAKFLETGQELAVMRGNHDSNPRGQAMSSFDLLFGVLEKRFTKNLVVARTVTHWRQFVLVPHLPNNDMFSLELSKLQGVKDRVFVFHSNFDSPYISDSLHSLNLTPEMVAPILKNGNKIVLGHEHTHRVLMEGSLLVLGNSVPSSVSDCLANTNKVSASFNGLDYVLETIVNLQELYSDIDWRNISHVSQDLKFIRVSGNATAEEAAQVVSAIATLRKRHSALVISNAVEIEGMSQFDDLAKVSFEDVAKFDVLGMLLEEFSAKEQEALRSLL